MSTKCGQSMDVIAIQDDKTHSKWKKEKLLTG